VNARDVVIPSTFDQYSQASQQVSSILSVNQSLLLVWPQVVVMIAVAVVCFAGAYVAFMRQEVRA
jgi:ABC-2 type transport system permease protein